MQAALAEATSVAQRALGSLRTLRALGCEAALLPEYGRSVDDAKAKAVDVGDQSAVFGAAVHFAANCSFAARIFRRRISTSRPTALSPRGYSADGSRRRRGWDVDIPWRRVMPRLGRGRSRPAHASGSLLLVLAVGGEQVLAGALSPGSLSSFLMYSLYLGFASSGLSTAYSRPRRSLASPFPAVAASTEYSRPRRGVAATRPHGISDPPPPRKGEYPPAGTRRSSERGAPPSGYCG